MKNEKKITEIRNPKNINKIRLQSNYLFLSKF